MAFSAQRVSGFQGLLKTASLPVLVSLRRRLALPILRLWYSIRRGYRTHRASGLWLRRHPEHKREK